MLRVSLLIQATERVTAPVRRIRSAIRGMARDGERDVGRVGRAMDRLRSIAGRAGAGIASSLRRGFSRGLDGLTALARRSASAIGSILGGALRIGAIGIGAGIGALLYRLTFGVIGTASSFEQLEVAMERWEGGTAGARRRMQWIMEFARRTPYDLLQVAEAFSSIRAYQIRAPEQALQALGNMASSLPNKTLEQAVEALADARQRQFERLREFAIGFETEGSRIRFTFGDIAETATESADDIEAALLRLMNRAFGGAMDRQSRTFAGMMRNLGDEWSRFELMIARAGFFDWVKRKISELLAWVDRISRDGRLQLWARQISERLVQIGDAITRLNWGQVSRDAADFGRAIWFVVRAVAALVRLLDRLSRLPSVTWLNPFLSGPITGVQDELERRRRAREEAIERSRQQAGPQRRFPGQLVPGLPGSGRLPGLPRPRDWLRPGAPVLQNGPSPRQQRAQPRAQADINLRIQTDRGTRATVTALRSSSPDYDVSVFRGRVMPG